MATKGQNYEAGLEPVAGPALVSSAQVARPASGLPSQYGHTTNASQRGPPEDINAQRNMIWSLRRKDSLCLVAVGIASLLAVVAVVLGVVLGTRRANDGPTTTVTATATPSPTRSPGSIRPKSSLGVTGWRSGAGISIRLLYQGDDGYIRTIGFDSSSGYWSDPRAIIKVRPGGPLALCSFHAATYFAINPVTLYEYFQLEIFFLDDTNRLQEWAIGDGVGWAINGSLSPVASSVGAIVKPNSKLTSYWPSIIFQDGSNTVQEIVHNGSAGWAKVDIGLKAQDYTSMAEVNVPGDTGLVGTSWGTKLFYQRDDGKLFAVSRNQTLGSWSADTFNQQIPRAASMGAFSVPRASSPQNKVDFYILWQDASGALQVSWKDDESGWKGPLTFPALAGADMGTDIACLNPTAWPASNLQPRWDMSRCYFQVNGQLREVHFNGLNWVIVGNVPV